MRKQLLLCVFTCLAPLINAQLLWEFSKQATDKPSYIFGTHHLAPTSILDEEKMFSAAFDSCSTIYGEVDITKIDNIDIAQKTLAMITLPADSTWTTLFSREELAELDSIVGKYLPLPEQQRNLLSPAFVSAQISIILALKEFPDYNPNQQLDSAILRLGQSAGKTIAGLETTEQQLNLLFGKPFSLQAREFIEEMRSLDENATKELTDVYMSRNISAIEKVIKDAALTPTQIEANRRLIDDRNQRWIETITDVVHPDESKMFVVGVGHLVGEKGLINLLRQNGYTVRQASHQ